MFFACSVPSVSFSNISCSGLPILGYIKQKHLFNVFIKEAWTPNVEFFKRSRKTNIFVSMNGKALCLICNKRIAVLK
jgi:hypothetical protein